MISQCFLVTGFVSDKGGQKDWNATVHMITQGSYSSLKKTENLAVKTGRSVVGHQLQKHDMVTTLLDTRDPNKTLFGASVIRPRYDLTFLGYVKPDIDVLHAGKFI
jgi:hypothetical protein